MQMCFKTNSWISSLDFNFCCLQHIKKKARHLHSSEYYNNMRAFVSENGWNTSLNPGNREINYALTWMGIVHSVTSTGGFVNARTPPPPCTTGGRWRVAPWLAEGGGEDKPSRGFWQLIISSLMRDSPPPLLIKTAWKWYTLTSILTRIAIC